MDAGKRRGDVMLIVIIVLLLVSITIGFLLDKPRAECKACGDLSTTKRAGVNYCSRCARDGDYRLLNKIWKDSNE